MESPARTVIFFVLQIFYPEYFTILSGKDGLPGIDGKNGKDLKGLAIMVLIIINIRQRWKGRRNRPNRITGPDRNSRAQR